MAKAPKKGYEKRVSDVYARVVQIAAIIAVVALAIVDLPDSETSIPAYIYGGLLGIAIGAKPEDIMRIRR